MTPDLSYDYRGARKRRAKKINGMEKKMGGRAWDCSSGQPHTRYMFPESFFGGG